MERAIQESNDMVEAARQAVQKAVETGDGAMLVKAQEATARTARELFPIVDKANDQPSADVLTQRIDIHEKTAWMLRSLLED